MRRRHCAVALVALLVASTDASAGSGNNSSTPLGLSAPIVANAPSVSGQPFVGSKLTADPGKWNGPSPSYAYQWARCTNSGTSCAPIATATAQTYVPVSVDLDGTVRVTVTASNKNGTTVATSDATAPVVSGAPPPTTTTTATTTTATTTTTSTTTPSSTTTTSTTTPTTTTAPAPAPVFTGDWETGSTSQWSNGSQCAGDNINNGIARGTYSIDTSPVAQGRYSAHFSLPSATVSNACEVVQKRTLNTGSDDYYAIDLMFPSNWQEPSPAGWGMVVAQFNYENIGTGPPIGLFAYAGKLALVIQSGPVVNTAATYTTGPDNNGNMHCSTATCQIIPQGQMTLGVWHQVIVHVHWATDATGSVETWWKRKGEASWTPEARFGGPTVQWTGTSPFAASFATYDKIGAYRGYASFPLSVWNDGFCRAASLASAETCP